MLRLTATTQSIGLITTAIALGGSAAALAEGNASSLGADTLSYENVGLRIHRSNIVTAFSGHLTQFFGDCPGKEWTGSATKDNVRFISYSQPPAKGLRVELLNLTSGESLKKKYTKEGYGSFDFKLISLGQGNGPQNVQYRIYEKATDATLEQGDFSYDLTTTVRSYRRDGEWRSELFCATDGSDSLKDCELIGGRQRLYCSGSRTSTVRDEYISHRRFKRPHQKRRPKKKNW